MSPDSPVTIVTREDGSTFAVPRFVWNIDREQAAVDVAEGVYQLKEIAERANTNLGTLATWRRNTEFADRVAGHRKEFRELVLSFGIAREETRMALLQDRHDQLTTVIKARGKAMQEKYPDVPGGETGYVYAKPTAYGNDFLIDNKTAALLNDIEKQAAIYRGEWSEGSGPTVAVQIVTPASLPDASKAPTVTIGARQI